IQELWANEGQPCLQEALNSSETLALLSASMNQVLEQLFHTMQAIQDRRTHSDQIREIREYIEREYANPNLSLDFLSDSFQMKAKSLSKIFKEETGQKFVDYLIEVRMKNAQR